MSQPHILLLDLDGVVLRPGGYHAALREAVSRIGAGLGFGDVDLSQEAIDEFEAAGVTAEWDSGAICAALLHLQAWEVDPALRLPTAPPLRHPAPHHAPLPDFRLFACRMHAQGRADRRPLELAEAMLLDGKGELSADQLGTIRGILRSARQPGASLTFHLVQELNLGSTRFSRVYGLPPALDTDSLLERIDRPALSSEMTARLLAWRAVPERCVAIFTNRPSAAPDGSGGSPEAELGLAAAGLTGLPTVALGGLAWLSAVRGTQPEAWLKPSPVHALAALRHAQGEALADSLIAAAGLVEYGTADEGWDRLTGARVVVFEDAAKGMASARAAAEVLALQGVPLELVLIGIAENPAKQDALRREGGRIESSLESALAPYLRP